MKRVLGEEVTLPRLRVLVSSISDWVHEKAGFALAEMSPDKDGILAGCLLANRVATSRENRKVHVARLEARFAASACSRIAIARTPKADHRAHERLCANPPQSVNAVRVRRCASDGDGLRLELADDGFLRLRQSGTESVMRIYAAADTQSSLAERLEAGCRLLEPETGHA